MLRRLARLKSRRVFSKKLQGFLRRVPKGLTVARDIALLVLAILAIFIAYRDYLKTDVRLEITAPAAGSVVLNKEITLEGTASGGPYNGYVVHHKAPGDEGKQEVRTVHEEGAQMSAPVFPLPLSLTDENGAPRIGRHTVTVTLKSGDRNVQQDSVAFDVIDCTRVVPRELATGKPLHEPIDLRPDEEIAGYEFLHYVDGTQWSLDSLDPAYLQDGYHDLRITAVVRGSEEEVDSVVTNFVVDNTAPIIDSIGLSDGACVSGWSVLVPTIHDPHMARLDLCVDNALVGVLEGEALGRALAHADLKFRLAGGWQEAVSAQPANPTGEERSEQPGLEDGWHDVVIKACDVNGLCSAEAARVWVDSTPPALQWDLPSDEAIAVLPLAAFWVGASSPDPEAKVVYSVEPPSTDVAAGFLDTTRCESGREYALVATAIDQAGNAETRITRFVVEQSPQAWANTALRAVRYAISSAMAPVSSLFGELAAEGLSIGVGTEVSAAPFSGRRQLWRGIADCVFIEICPVVGRGFNENTTVGVAFRVPLRSRVRTESDTATSLIQPAFEFGTALTPNWEVIDSFDPGVEEIVETWLKIAFATEIAIPLPLMGDMEIGISAGPGCKLTFVQELIRGTEFTDDEPVGIERFTQDSVKLELTMDISIAFSAGSQP
jgi:hypothetical protein